MAVNSEKKIPHEQTLCVCLVPDWESGFQKWPVLRRGSVWPDLGVWQ